MKKLLITLLIAVSLITSTPTSVFAQYSGVADTSMGHGNVSPEYHKAVTTIITDPLKAGKQVVADTLDPTGCISGGITQCVQQVFTKVVETVGNLILSGVSWLLWFAGIVFNFSIIVLVIHMKDVLNSIPAIFDVWKVLRDFANMFFIFILLYISINTILGVPGWKKMLTNVILVALFINFSFFATGLLIDASNIFSLQFYNGFAGANCTGKYTGDLEKADGCMSYKIVSALKLQSIYDISGATTTTQDGGTMAALSAAGNNANANLAKFIISIIAGSLLMVIAAGIFIASAILIFWRFVELLVLLMISPIAFAFIVIPSTKEYWNEWWNRLVKNLTFAPAYFMFLWICFKVIGSGGLAAKLGATSTFQSAFSSGADPKGVFALLANYIIIILLLGYSLVLATKLGGAGVKQATAAAKGFQGFVGRNTVGKAAYSISNSNAMREFASKSPALARIVSKPLDSLGKQGFGTKVGYEKALENRKKELVAGGKFVGETGLLVPRKGETPDAFKARQKAEDADAKKRKSSYAEAISARDGSITSRASNALGISAVLRSNKEAYADMSKQIGKDEADEQAKKDRKEALEKAHEDMQKLQITMGHTVGANVPGKPATLADDAEEERIREQEIDDLAKIEAELGSLDPKTQKAQVAVKLAEKKRLENRRKQFETLRNKINSINDKIDRSQQDQCSCNRSRENSTSSATSS